MTDEELTRAARDIETAAPAFCSAVINFSRGVAEKHSEAFRQGGPAGADDVNAVASGQRIAQEVLGVLLAGGLRDLLATAGCATSLPPVSDFATRWERRIAGGQLETRRVRA